MRKLFRLSDALGYVIVGPRVFSWAWWCGCGRERWRCRGWKRLDPLRRLDCPNLGGRSAERFRLGQVLRKAEAQCEEHGAPQLDLHRNFSRMFIKRSSELFGSSGWRARATACDGEDAQEGPARCDPTALRLPSMRRGGVSSERTVAGTAVNYVTRSKAIKKLQISIKDFRHAIADASPNLCRVVVAPRLPPLSGCCCNLDALAMPVRAVLSCRCGSRDRIYCLTHSLALQKAMHSQGDLPTRAEEEGPWAGQDILPYQGRELPRVGARAPDASGSSTDRYCAG
jgi:hypothetical protein